ncbi:MAG TPA: glycosyltransferase family 2 protein [Gemmatimonadales bacterium]|nr:glycosyltransferase family 2 protein [Gemmatimonadales bacterium]
MRPRYLLVLFIGVLVMLLAVTAMVYLISRIPFAGQGLVLFLGVTMLLVFLVILIIRYLSLMWLGYLHHIETKIVDPPEESPYEPLVTIIVPAFNEEAVIDSAVQSLLELDYPAYEILVVDDGSSDGTAARVSALEGHYGDVTIRLVSKENGGKAAALNTGIALARHPFVLCMDGDSRLTPPTLRYAMRHFRDPRVAAVAGNVKVVNRRNLWTKLQALEYIEGLNMARRAQGFLRAVNIIPGPIGIFRRDVLTQVGGYDTDTFAEDADLTLKLLTAGYHVIFEDQAIAYTEAPEELLDLLKQRYRWTRGILQSLMKRKAWLFLPKHGAAIWASLLFMFFEAILWPAANILGNLVFAIAALEAGVATYVLYWWLLLTLLDVTAAAYTIAMEEEDLWLIPYAVVYRYLFIATIDVTKLLATVEEFLGVRMTWGKLQRAGRI